MKDQSKFRPFPDAQEDIRHWDEAPDTAQTRHPAYRLAFADGDFMLRDELRPVRLQLELLKPDLLMTERGIQSTIVMFGGARIRRPDDPSAPRTPMMKDLARFYQVAREFAHAMTLRSVQSYGREDVIVTGGGPGVMEAGNLGAKEAGGISIGLNIVLPHEQAPNDYVTPDLCFNFHYFAIRKMHFLIRARALIAFPGGFGTMDELFETLTLIQTHRIKPMPVLLFGRDFWRRVVNFEALVEEGTISESDLRLFSYVETAEEAWEYIARFNGLEEGTK